MRAVLMLAAIGCAASAASAQVLVFDENSINHYAQAGASAAGLGAVTVAGSSNFNTLLTSGTWQAVAVDCPSSVPDGGWGTLINYVKGGKNVVMSFWDWNDAALGDPQLVPTFGGTSTSSLSTQGRTLTADAGALGAQLFAGVGGMPHSDWSDNWGDDGDAFGMAAGSEAGAYLSGFSNPVIMRGNGGKTIASFVIDEWKGAGSPATLWKNMIGATIPAPGAVAGLGLGVLAMGRRRR